LRLLDAFQSIRILASEKPTHRKISGLLGVSGLFNLKKLMKGSIVLHTIRLRIENVLDGNVGIVE
jgi:hypothetical protein